MYYYIVSQQLNGGRECSRLLCSKTSWVKFSYKFCKFPTSFGNKRNSLMNRRNVTMWKIFIFIFIQYRRSLKFIFHFLSLSREHKKSIFFRWFTRGGLFGLFIRTTFLLTYRTRYSHFPYISTRTNSWFLLIVYSCGAMVESKGLPLPLPTPFIINGFFSS